MYVDGQTEDGMDVRERCQYVGFAAHSFEEEKFLAELFNAVKDCGEIIVKIKKRGLALSMKFRRGKRKDQSHGSNER